MKPKKGYDIQWIKQMIFNQIEVEIDNEIVQQAVKTVRRKIKQHKRKMKKRKAREAKKNE